MTDVIALKLVSGEEIIAHLERTTADLYELSQPRIVGLARNQQGVGVAFGPFFLSVEDNSFTVWRNNVIAEASEDKINKELLAGYMKETSLLDLSAPPPALIKK